MSGRRRNVRGEGGRLRADLLSAARALAEQHSSVDALTIRSVAKAAGVAATSVYLHFRDRDEIFRAAVGDDYKALENAMAEAAQAEADPVARLRAIGMAYCRFAEGNPGSYRLITEVVQPAPASGPRPEGHPATGIQDILQRAITDCQAAGFATGVDPEVLLSCLWSGWHGFVQLRRAKPQREWPMVSAVVGQLVAGLVTGTPSPRRATRATTT